MLKRKERFGDATKDETTHSAVDNSASSSSNNHELSEKLAKRAKRFAT
jgi:hypothetical protein